MPEHQSKIVPLLALFAEFKECRFPGSGVAELRHEEIDFIFLDQVRSRLLAVRMLMLLVVMRQTESRVAAQGRRMLHRLHLL